MSKGKGGDNFLERFKSNAQRQRAERTFDIDLSEYSDEFEGEVWTIKPLTGQMQDKVIPLYVRDSKLYEAISTTLFYRACKPGTNIQRFKNPQAITDFQADPEFLDWFATKIKFHEEMRAFLTGEEEAEAVKNSSGTTGFSE